MGQQGPRSEVFTTALVNDAGEVADWPAHVQRLNDHAKRLRIALPPVPPSLPKDRGMPWRLARIACKAGAMEWDVAVRTPAFRDEAVDAITVPAPRWNERTNGCKHGDWQPYRDAKEAAEQAGCDAALLIHDHAIVDGDRATPLVLDEDGTVWLAPESDGGVPSVTVSLLENHLPNSGFPVIRCRLNERTVARCAELVLVGTGMGACRVDSLDGEPLGCSRALSTTCQNLLREHFTDTASWSQPGQERVD
jgi:branched-subunit amino acid aminotransferase/4-amino-4-deoxychorismate lyase